MGYFSDEPYELRAKITELESVLQDVTLLMRRYEDALNLIVAGHFKDDSIHYDYYVEGLVGIATEALDPDAENPSADPSSWTWQFEIPETII